MRVKADTDAIRQALQCGQPGCACGQPRGLVHCPGHADSNLSLSVSNGRSKILVKCFGGCSQDLVIDALKARGLWPSGNGNGAQGIKPRIVTTYDYLDARGKMIFQVCRLEPKSFRQRRPDGKGDWIWNLTGVARVPYRLPQVLTTATVFVVEGEKDADNLAALGMAATCNPGGAGKWRHEYNNYLRGKAIVILPDNDDPGLAHAQNVARSLQGIAAGVKILELPDMPKKGDVSDWLEAGGTLEKLEALVEAAPEWDPATTSPERKSGREDKPTQAATLLALAADAELFHTPDYECYARITINGHKEARAIRSRAFRLWLLRQFHGAERKPPQSEALQAALGVLESRAQFDGPERPVWVRVAEHEGNIYLDLGNPAWEAIKISPLGWQIVAEPPVCFRRPKSMAALPYPERDGTVNELRPFLNCSDADFTLIIAWILAAMRPLSDNGFERRAWYG